MSTTVPEAVGPETFTSWAFLSYSHRDRKPGDWLHRALETYPVPKRNVGQPTRDGQRPRKLFPLFRDTEELSASAEARLAENRGLAAQASERQADQARDQADGLINFVLHDLRDKLQPIGRLDC